MDFDGYEVNWIDCYQVIRKRIRTVVMVVLLVVVYSAIKAHFIPNTYLAEAVILPLGQNVQTSVAYTDLSPLIGGLGEQSASTKLMTLLGSRTLAERVIKRFDLMKYYFKDAWDPQKNDWITTDPKKRPSIQVAVDVFKVSVLSREDNRAGVITVSAEFPDPKLAARLANGMLDELQKFISENAFTEAKRNRVFIGERLLANRRELLEAGKDLSEYYQQNKISSSLATVDVPLGFTPETDGISNLSEANLGAKSTEQVENSQEEKQKQVAYGIPQQVYLDYLVQRREALKVLNGLLSQQYEMAKIDETKADISFQVIDEAIAPEKKFKPHRRQMVMVAFVIGILGAVFLALVMEFVEKIRTQQKAV